MGSTVVDQEELTVLVTGFGVSGSRITDAAATLGFGQ